LAIQKTETALAEAANASYAVLLDALGGDPAAPETHSAALARWSFAHGLALLLMDGRVRPEQVGARDAAGTVAVAVPWLRIGPNSPPPRVEPKEAKRAREKSPLP
jgi:hypothetical protein